MHVKHYMYVRIREITFAVDQLQVIHSGISCWGCMYKQAIDKTAVSESVHAGKTLSHKI